MRPENRVLALADEGARYAHYVLASRYPERYPGHSGPGFTECYHTDCWIVRQRIENAVERL